jgi:hypothetical protein
MFIWGFTLEFVLVGSLLELVFGLSLISRFFISFDDWISLSDHLPIVFEFE